MNLTPQQWLAMAVGLCAFLAGSGSAAQLSEIFGGSVAGDIAAGCGLLGGILTIPLTMLSGQAAQVRAVASLPGVEKIQTNNDANGTLKAIAQSDADVDRKVEPPK